MTTEIKKKGPAHHEEHHQGEKGKALNSILWLLAIVCVAVAAVGNAYFSMHFSLIVRVLLLVVLCVAAVGLAALTNQGKKAIHFMKESRLELRKIVWPSRQEATQTTLIVVAFTVVVSLALWGIDSIIVSIITFLTSLRF